MDATVDTAARRARVRERRRRLDARREAVDRVDDGLVRALGDAHRDRAVVALRADGVEAARSALVDAVDWRLRLVDRRRAAAVTGDPDPGTSGDGRGGGSTDAGPLEEALWLACALGDPSVARPVAREVLAAPLERDGAVGSESAAGDRARHHRARYAAVVASPDAGAVASATPAPPGVAGGPGTHDRPGRTTVDAAARAARGSLATWARTASLDATASTRHLLLGLDGLADRDDAAAGEAIRRLAFDHWRSTDDPPATAALVCLPALALAGIARLRAGGGAPDRGPSIDLDATPPGLRAVVPGT
jgi:hypothetical protein